MYLRQNGGGRRCATRTETESQVIQLGRSRRKGEAVDDGFCRSIKKRLTTRTDADRHHDDKDDG